ncbi:MAG TPA: nicotinamide riboside transporter PnuC [Candidatus Paceibacterota bacterium]|nr:nicotinamide riboside transporter PnuC [Candidatus Paceibacterota bacterium]
MTIRALLGTKHDVLEQTYVALAMLVVTFLYEGITAYAIPGFTFNIYEAVGTWTGLVCVWLSRTRNILCWPWGIVSALSLGFFFSQIGLPGQQWLNWVYFMIIQLWAWPHWAFGGADKTELPVTELSWKGKVLTVLAILAGTALVYYAIGYFAPGSFHPLLDALVVASSVVAQYLLGKKKVESWILWLGPVNLVSIVLFAMAGAYTVAALYLAFFIHAIFALGAWTKAKSHV